MKREEFVVEDVMPHKVDVYRFGEGSPRVLITAGLHGGEVTGQYAAFGLMEHLKKENPEGEVIIIPRANPAAFRRMQRKSPYDERDMNRIFPGDKNGTPSEVLARKIWEVAQTADYIVDLHCCGIYGSAYTLAQYKEYDFAKDLAAKLDIPIVVQSAGARGQLFVEACREDIPAVIIELPGGGRSGVIDLASGDRTTDALVGLLECLDILPDEFKDPNPVFCEPLRRITSPQDGLFLPQVSPGSEFDEDQVLATIEGESVGVDFSGRVVMARPAGYVFRGSSVMAVTARAEDV